MSPDRNQKFMPTSTTDSVSDDDHDDHYDEETEAAVKQYQKNFNLEQTGILDEKTVAQMQKPRCGNSDSDIRRNGYNKCVTSRLRIRPKKIKMAKT